jgi:single-strand DNA-binding protein
MAINKVILLGRVGKDPEIKQFDGGNKASFSLATTERGYTAKNGEVRPEVTTWHNIVCWKGLATIAERFVKKGDLIYIEGKITTRSWESDGKKHYMTEIVADNIELLGNKTESKATEEPPREESGSRGINDDDSIPF